MEPQPVSFPSSFYRWRPHPWHGLEVGEDPPRLVQAYIELTPFDVIKYEVDKTTGYLRVDRPQRGSAMPPTLYGFVPRTLCGDRVGAIFGKGYRGDGDPLDICVVSERPINRTEVILSARVIGGLQMLDEGRVDDKIIAILANDNVWQASTHITDLPAIIIERLRHYFSTYKMIPGESQPTEVSPAYDAEHAFTVIEAAMADYADEYGT
jgi:inorganic pyrophosphatase